jgi:hypothetical protein
MRAMFKKSVVVGAAAAAVTGGMLMLGVGAANAATSPTYEPDPGAIGTVAFYNAAGTQITSGTLDPSGNPGTPMAAYYLASGHGPAADTTAQVAFATPQQNIPTGSWTSVNLQTSSQTYPPPASNTYPGILHTTTNALVQGDDFGLGFQIGTNPNTDANDPNIYQIRLYTDASTYFSADVVVSGSTWTQIYPAVSTATTTQLTSSANPTTTGTNVILTATESPAAAGSVQFKDGSTNLGSPVAVNGSGVTTLTQAFSTTGAHNLSAVFAPTDTAAFGASTGTLTENVDPPPTSTTTGLAVNQSGTAGTDVQMVATVSPSAAPGSVVFYDNGSATALPGTVTQTPAGMYTLDLPSGLSAGAHSIVAKFSPTDVTQFEASQSTAVLFTLSPPAGDPCTDSTTTPPTNTCVDQQTFKVNVPTGTLVISTPWTPTNPFDLGNLQLSSNGTTLHTSAPFGTPAPVGGGAPYSDGVTVTDTRSGDLPWHADVTTTDFTKGSDSINGCNLGFTAVDAHYITGNAIDGATANKTVTTTPLPNGGAGAIAAPGAACTTGVKGGSHTFASIPHGVGSVYIGGSMDLWAPTSTPAGDYFATVTFTVFTS